MLQLNKNIKNIDSVDSDSDNHNIERKSIGRILSVIFGDDLY